MCIRLRALGERLEGTYAQFVKLPAQNCFPMPAGFTFEEAAAFPLVYITLWRMLIPNAKLKPGEPMLIIGIGFKFPVSRKKGPVTFAYDLALGTGAVKRGFRV
jgi:D-arabinose 1-dehydrogenase-like Zn-dependent alcohol dehydrogenase